MSLLKRIIPKFLYKSKEEIENMDAEVLKLGSGMILGGATAVVLGSNWSQFIPSDITVLGWLAFVLGSLIVALTVVES